MRRLILKTLACSLAAPVALVRAADDMMVPGAASAPDATSSKRDPASTGAASAADSGGAALAPTAAEVSQTVRALRHGGVMLVMRHGATDRDDKDRAPESPTDCAANRALSDIGRLNASGWGKFLHAIKAPVDAVYSSEFCRCTETGRRLGYGEPETIDYLTIPPTSNPAILATKGQDLRHLVRRVRRHSVIAIITHLPIITGAFGAAYIDLLEGDAIVVRPFASSSWSPVGRLPLLSVSDYTRTMHLILPKLPAGAYS